MGCFIWINTILGNFKTAITGTYHAIHFKKYCHRYLGEYQYRFNLRFDLAAMLSRLNQSRYRHWPAVRRPVAASGRLSLISKKNDMTVADRLETSRAWPPSPFGAD